MYKCLDCKKKFIYMAKRTEKVIMPKIDAVIETNCCPYCYNIHIEPIRDYPLEKIVDVQYIEKHKIGEFIKKGYQPVNYYKDYAIVKKVELID